MGEIVIDIELENAGDVELVRRGSLREADVRRATVGAVVDTGALMLALPEDVVALLGVAIVDRGVVSYADGRRGELPIAGPLTVRIGDRWAFSRCVVVPTDADALVGQLVLEELDLVADCRNQTLGPRPEAPDFPVFRM